MEEKTYTYLVEVMYENVIVENQGEPEMTKRIEIDTQVYTFNHANKSVAKQNASRFYDQVFRYGLKRQGGSIIKSVVPPAAIKLIGMVDLELWLEEQELMKSEPVSSFVPSDVVAVTEATQVDSHVDAD